MKFYLNENAEIQLAPEISKHVIVINDEQFEYNNVRYNVQPMEFNINDVYFLFAELVKNNPNRKIFIHHFEPLAHDFYAVYLAIER